MSESILEQLARWHLALINSITAANGYQQTLVATRSMELSLDAAPAGDLSVVCELGPVEKENETLDQESPTITWWQQFDAFVCLLGRGGTGLAEDNRITRIVADIHQRIGVELAAQAATDGPYCGGLAAAIELLPWEIGVWAGERGNCTFVNVPIRIQYTVLTRDPYRQP